MRTRLAVVVAIVSLLSTVSSMAAADTGGARSEPVLGLQRISRTNTNSLNWSGYAIYNDAGPMTFNDVQGSWTQPAVQGNCPKRKTTLAAFFVGIDGYNSGSVEQIGTDTDCVNGSPSYYAWYEMYPAAPVYLSTTNYPVAPGDVLSGEVSYNSGTGQFTLSLDNDCGCGSWPFSITLSAAVTPARTSAEWIAETPSTGGHYWPLTDFGSVTFTNASATNDSAHTGHIDDSAWSYDKINIVSRSRRGGTLATTSGLTGGAAFTVTYGS